MFKGERVASDFREMRKIAATEIAKSDAAIVIYVKRNENPPIKSLLISREPEKFPEYMFELMYGMSDLMSQILSSLAEPEIIDTKNGR
jgi:hypothetical protein